MTQDQMLHKVYLERTHTHNNTLYVLTNAIISANALALIALVYSMKAFWGDNYRIISLN